MTDALTFPCENCGAKLNYDAATQAMACPFCGHKRSVASSVTAPAIVREIPIEEGMRMAARGLGAAVHTIACKECGATVNVGQGERTTSCAFCGSQQVLSQQTDEQAIRPESMVPFKVAKEDANQRFGKWLATLWFRPGDLKKIAKVHEMGGVYVPFWTFDSHVRSNWSAERGWHYYETESYSTYENGQSVTRTREVQRTRWEYATGFRQDWFDDILICAGTALPADLVARFQSFDTRTLVPYQPQFLAGWRAEAYTIDLMPAWSLAQQRIANVQQGRCAGDVGGDTQRSLSVNNQFFGVTFKHVMLPIWIAAYRYNNKVYRFLVNGQSGEVVGKAPFSFWKIFFFVMAILVVIGAVVGVVLHFQNEDEGSTAPATTLTSPTITVSPIKNPAILPSVLDIPSAASLSTKPSATPRLSASTKPAPSMAAKLDGGVKPIASSQSLTH